MNAVLHILALLAKRCYDCLTILTGTAESLRSILGEIICIEPC